MYKQIFIPNEQNYLVPIPRCWYGCEVEVIISPISKTEVKARNNWAEAAKQMRQVNDDVLLMPAVLNNENLDWWTWNE